MVELPVPLQEAVDAELSAFPVGELRVAADRLSQRYRADQAGGEPILRTMLDAAAYLTTRMPATYAAVRQVFDRLGAS